MMAAYLLVTVALCGPVGKVKPFEDGILTEHFLDFQHSLLTAAFLCKFFFLALMLSFCFLIIGEKIELDRLPASFRLGLIHKMVDGECQTAHKQVKIYNPVVKFRRFLYQNGSR